MILMLDNRYISKIHKLFKHKETLYQTKRKLKWIPMGEILQVKLSDKNKL